MAKDTPAPSIRVRDNGPYVVTGPMTIRRKRIVHSEHGEPLTYLNSAPLDTGDASTVVLCRCGASDDKPFCDLAHCGLEWDAAETASGTYAERSRELGGTGITVRDDRSICGHAGFCGTRISNIWKLTAETADSGTRLQVINMVEKCPSGALTFRFDDTADVEPVLPVEIGVLDDGPLWVQGKVEILTGAGEVLETRNRVTRCRCGASANKPLCDGSHNEAGFTDPS